MWAGIAGSVTANNTQYEIAISIHDSVYNTDFTSIAIPYTPGNLEKTGGEVEQKVLDTLRVFSENHLCKFLGAGVTLSLLREVRILKPYAHLLMFKLYRHPTFVPVSGWRWTLCPLYSISSLIIQIP